jgi:pilus assembly protein Flp/PilA
MAKFFFAASTLVALKDRRGATAIEYGLIAAGVSVAIAITVWAIGDNVSTIFTSIKDALVKS